MARRAFGRRGKRKVRERCTKGEDKCLSLNSGEAPVRAGKARPGARGRGIGGPTCEG